MAHIYQLLEREVENLKKTDPYKVGESGLIVDDLERLRGSILSCCSGSVARRNISTGEKKVLSFAICGKSKLCPKCADIEYMKRMQSLAKWYEVNAEYVDSAYMVTFTQKKIPDESARDASRRILKNFRKFQRIGQKDREKEYSSVLGGFRSLELSATDTGFHAHIHAIVFTSNRLDFVTYDQKIKRELRKEKGWLKPEQFKLEMEKRGGVFDSKIKKEWNLCGLDCENIDVRPIFDNRTKPKSLFSSVQQDKKLAKLIRYSLKYSMKDNEFEGLKAGQLFEIIDSMKGTRKNQFLGGVGKYEVEKDLDEDFELNDHKYEVKMKEKFTDDHKTEKIIRELLPEEKKKNDQLRRELIAKLRSKRTKFFEFFNVGVFDSRQYTEVINSLYIKLKTQLKQLKNSIETQAEYLRNRMKIECTVWRELSGGIPVGIS